MQFMADLIAGRARLYPLPRSSVYISRLLANHHSLRMMRRTIPSVPGPRPRDTWEPPAGGAATAATMMITNSQRPHTITMSHQSCPQTHGRQSWDAAVEIRRMTIAGRKPPDDAQASAAIDILKRFLADAGASYTEAVAAQKIINRYIRSRERELVSAKANRRPR